jgi:hypothetical protein
MPLHKYIAFKPVIVYRGHITANLVLYYCSKPIHLHSKKTWFQVEPKKVLELSCMEKGRQAIRLRWRCSVAGVFDSKTAITEPQ